MGMYVMRGARDKNVRERDEGQTTLDRWTLGRDVHVGRRETSDETRESESERESQQRERKRYSN